MKRRIIFIYLVLAINFMFVSCKTTEILADTEEIIETAETVKAGQLPILMVCPGGPETENNINSFNFFLEPQIVEESENSVITIKTNIPDMEVYINNTFQGKTDLNIMDLVPGSYILELKKEGYKPFQTFVTVNRNRKYTYFINVEINNE